MGRGLWSALCVLVLACAAEDPGPLDPQTVAKIPTEQGDATGYDLTGPYLVTSLVTVDCLCAESVGLVEGRCLLESSLGPWLNVVQADGQIRIDPGMSPAIGPLFADGTFRAGAVTFVTAIVGRLETIWRLDGAITQDPETDRPLLAATVSLRLLGETLAPAPDETDGESAAPSDVDCVEVVEIEALGQF